jgi:hypothetical protein
MPSVPKTSFNHFETPCEGPTALWTRCCRSKRARIGDRSRDRLMQEAETERDRPELKSGVWSHRSGFPRPSRDLLFARAIVIAIARYRRGGDLSMRTGPCVIS